MVVVLMGEAEVLVEGLGGRVVGLDVEGSDSCALFVGPAETGAHHRASKALATAGGVGDDIAGDDDIV